MIRRTLLGRHLRCWRCWLTAGLSVLGLWRFGIHEPVVDLWGILVVYGMFHEYVTTNGTAPVQHGAQAKETEWRH